MLIGVKSRKQGNQICCRFKDNYEAYLLLITMYYKQDVNRYITKLLHTHVKNQYVKHSDFARPKTFPRQKY